MAKSDTFSNFENIKNDVIRLQAEMSSVKSNVQSLNEQSKTITNELRLLKTNTSSTKCNTKRYHQLFSKIKSTLVLCSIISFIMVWCIRLLLPNKICTNKNIQCYKRLKVLIQFKADIVLVNLIWSSFINFTQRILTCSQLRPGCVPKFDTPMNQHLCF